MTKQELIKALEKYDDNAEVFFSHSSETDLVEITDVIVGERKYKDATVLIHTMYGIDKTE